VLNDFLREGEATEQDVDNQYESCLKLIEDLEVRNMLRKEEDQLAHPEDQLRDGRRATTGLQCL
jgi:hypothetical protein